jgi:hypothetical protein
MRAAHAPRTMASIGGAQPGRQLLEVDSQPLGLGSVAAG